MLSTLMFVLVSALAIGGFVWQANRIRQAVLLGRPEDRTDNPAERWKKVLLVAVGQKKMFKLTFPALMHLFIYVAFVITQVELVEIFIDGVVGTHRIFYPILDWFYVFVVSSIELFSVLAFVATLVFLARRNLLKVPRLSMNELNGWPKLDGNIILYLEILLIVFIFMMNGADEVLYNRGQSHAAGTEGETGSFNFLISQWLGPALFGGVESPQTLHLLERIGWWGHVLVVFAFLNYLPISKHFHILLSFPNVYYSDLEPAGKFEDNKLVYEEVKAAFDPSYTPEEDPSGATRFGARDVNDLTWKSLLDSYTCTECGRCTAVCPANITGKKLSPRKIVMEVRDRLEEIQKYKLKPDENGDFIPANGVEGADEVAKHYLLGEHHITQEELAACTTCNACVESCPVNINHLDIIVPLRQYLIMEDSKMPESWTATFNNIENNGAPWAFPAASRFDWASDVPPLGQEKEEKKGA